MPFQPYFFNDTPTEVEQIIKNALENYKQSGDIAELQKILPELNAKIANVVSEKLTEWHDDGSLRTILNHRKILIVGDSYLAGVNLPSPTTQNFGYLLSYQGFDITAMSTSGGGFIAFGNNSRFYELIENYNNPDVNEYTDIFFVGGVNDSYQDMTNLKSAIVSTVSLARSKFPNATCHIGYISQLRRINGNPLSVNACQQIYKSASLEAKCCYMDNSETMLKNAAFISNDGLHPSPDGQREIANYLTSYILNGNISTLQMQPSLNFVLNASNFDDIYRGNPIMMGNVYQKNDITTLTVLNAPVFNASSTLAATGMPLDGTSSIIMGNLSNCLIWAQSANSNTFSNVQWTVGGVLAWRSEPTGTIHYSPCAFTMRMVQNTVFCTPQLLEDVGTYRTAYIEQINLNPFTATFCSNDC